MDPSQGHFQDSISAPVSNPAPHRPTLVPGKPESSRTNEFTAEGPDAGQQDQMALLLPATVPKTVLTESPVNMTTRSQPSCRAGPSRHQPTASMPFSSLGQRPWILAAESQMHSDTSTRPHEATRLIAASFWPSPKTHTPIWQQRVPAPHGPPPLATQQSHNTFDIPMSAWDSQTLQANLPNSKPLPQGTLDSVLDLPFSTPPVVGSNPADNGPAMQSQVGSNSLQGNSGSFGIFLSTASVSQQPSLAQDANGLAAMSKSLDDMLARTCETAPHAAHAPASKFNASTVERHLIDYKRSLTDAHIDRLGGLLGLDHPLPTAVELEAANPQDSMQMELQTRILPASSMPDCHKKVEVERLLALPRRASSGAVFLIDGEDCVIRSSDCLRIYEVCLSGDMEGADLTFVDKQYPVRFSDLLADEEMVRWWQKISRKILQAHRQWQEILRQANDHSGPSELKMRWKEEVVLRWKCKVGRSDLVAVTAAASTESSNPDQACLLVKVKLLSLPKLATAAIQPILPSLRSRTHVSTHRQGPSLTPSARSTGAELRLLVSRYGLILRASCPAQWPSTSGPLLPQLILGDGIAVPRHGQSLVDIPRLTPLLHVVAQAAIVGLAQTVKLNMGGRQITAVVQPVLRSSNSDSDPAGRLRLTAAKVWIGLSAAKEVARHSGSTSVTSKVGFASSFSDFEGLTPDETSVGRPLLSDRRHSVQVPPRATPVLPDRRASTASLYAHAALHQASISAQSSSSFWNSFAVDENNSSMLKAPTQAESLEVEDHLSQLVANLEQENRMLRKEIAARLQRRLTPVPPRSQAPSTSENPSLSAEPYRSLRSGRTIWTCPSNLMHLS